MAATNVWLNRKRAFPKNDEKEILNKTDLIYKCLTCNKDIRTLEHITIDSLNIHHSFTTVYQSRFKGEFLATTTYNICEVVRYESYFYVSLSCKNAGNIPSLAENAHLWMPTEHGLYVVKLPRKLKYTFPQDPDHLHFAKVDTELCEYDQGPILAIGIMHASYRKYKHYFHSYSMNACDRSWQEYTSEGLRFWANPGHQPAHNYLFKVGKGLSLDKILREFLIYKYMLESIIPHITFLYDDPHADFHMIDQALQSCKLPGLQRDHLGDYNPWKCCRDLIQGSFRILAKEKEFISFQEVDIDRVITKKWSEHFVYKGANVADVAKSTNVNVAKSTNANVVKSTTDMAKSTNDSKIPNVMNVVNEAKSANVVAHTVNVAGTSIEVDMVKSDSVLDKPISVAKIINNKPLVEKIPVTQQFEFDLGVFEKMEHLPVADLSKSFRRLFKVEDLRCLLFS